MWLGEEQSASSDVHPQTRARAHTLNEPTSLSIRMINTKTISYDKASLYLPEEINRASRHCVSYQV